LEPPLRNHFAGDDYAGSKTFNLARQNVRRQATAVDSEEIVIRMPTMIVIAQIVLVVSRADLWWTFIDLSWAGLAFVEPHAKQGLQTIRKRRVRAWRL
jgi:hypothetical protein